MRSILVNSKQFKTTNSQWAQSKLIVLNNANTNLCKLYVNGVCTSTKPFVNKAQATQWVKTTSAFLYANNVNVVLGTVTNGTSATISAYTM